MNRTTAREANSGKAIRQPLVWGLLGLWLLYSAAALGWHLATDPFLSQYICRSR